MSFYTETNGSVLEKVITKKNIYCLFMLVDPMISALMVCCVKSEKAI
jgi:hypothetical protein